jgi:hypothetical protein
MQEEQRQPIGPTVPSGPTALPVSVPSTPRWMYVVAVIALGLTVLVVILHLSGNGLRH